MMRERAAQRVQAFSRYNAAPPSLYPNQAAPYGSFPYADPTPAIWDSSPERLRQDVPADPKYQGWDFNQEPIADTSAISNVPFVSDAIAGPTVNKFTPVGSDYTPQQLNTPINELQQQNIPSNVIPLDPTGGLAATDSVFTGMPSVFTGPGTQVAQVGGIPSGRTFGVPAAEGYGYVETPYSFTGDFNGQPRTDVYSGSDPGLETVTPLFDALTMGTGIKGAIAVGKVLSNLDRVPSTHSLPGMRFSYRDWPNQRLAPFSNTPAWRGTTKVNPVTPASVLNKPAAQIAVGLTPDVVGVTQQPAYTGGDPTIPGLNPALANPNITAMNTLSEDFDELAFGAFGTKHVPGTSLPVTPPDSMLMQDFIDKYGPVQSGTRDAYYHRDGTVRNAAGDIVSTPDATYNEYAGMGQVASHPGQGGYIGDTERTIGEHLAAVNERVQAMPAVTTSQALSTQDEQQQAMPEVSVPAPTAPTVAAVAAQNRLAQQQADAAMARAAQEAALRDQARQAAQRAAVQADIAAAQAEQDRVRQAKALMNSKSYQESGLDGLSAAERDIVAAAQVDTFAGINRQVRGDRDTSGERSAGMGGGRGGFAGPDRW